MCFQLQPISPSPLATLHSFLRNPSLSFYWGAKVFAQFIKSTVEKVNTRGGDASRGRLGPSNLGMNTIIPRKSTYFFKVCLPLPACTTRAMEEAGQAILHPLPLWNRKDQWGPLPGTPHREIYGTLEADIGLTPRKDIIQAPLGLSCGIKSCPSHSYGPSHGRSLWTL